VRFRLIAAFGTAVCAAAALLSLAACRNSPQVAAYIGDTQIPEARVTQLQDDYNKGEPADHQVSRAIVVSYLVRDELCRRLSKEKGFTYTPAEARKEASEFELIAMRADACVNAIPQGTLTEGDYRALYDRAVADGRIAPEASYADIRQFLQSRPDLLAVLDKESQLNKVAKVDINPRYGTIPVLGLLPAGSNPIVVLERPPTAAPQQQQ
jgi:hypothetical protein